MSVCKQVRDRRFILPWLVALALTLSVMVLGTTVGAEDGVIADPKHYKVEFENEKVRVVRITYGPQEQSVMHGHNAGVVIEITGVHAKVTLPDGTTQEVTTKPGQFFWYDGSDHMPENLGDKPFETILVEIKD